MKEALFWQKKNGGVQCLLCPRACLIAKGSKGYCRARKNINGALWSMVYPHAISPSVDPVEKKPLYHFLPGSRAFSFGTAGCNLKCLWCQNWDVAQACPEDVASVELPPEKIIQAAKEDSCKSIAYTYTEPTIFYEYMLDTAKLAKKSKIKNIIVSNGFINSEPLEQACKYIDGANIDLKVLDDAIYKKYTGAWLAPILESLKILKARGVWLEITHLIVPDVNDDKKLIKKLIIWVKENLGTDVPLHFSAFYPAYQMIDKTPTSPNIVKEARRLAIKEGLNYVYSGNIHDEEGSTTYCPSCKKALIKRAGFSVTENNISKGKCKFCEEKIPGIWN